MSRDSIKNPTHSRWFRRFAAFLAAFLLLSWTVLPASAMDLDEEKELGRKFYEKLRERLPLIEDGEMADYVRSVGERVVKAVGPNSHYEYTFLLVDSKVTNAFAIPGGYIFVYRGIIELMDTESELAAILGHEIGHVEARHIAHRAEKELPLTIATVAGVLAAVFLGAQGGGQAGSALMQGVLAGTQTARLGYSREDEREADRRGFNYFCEAGYDPEDMAVIMQKLSRANYRTDDQFPSYLSTHPAVSERAQYLRDMARRYEKSDEAKKQRRDPLGEFPMMRAALVAEYDYPPVARDRLDAWSKRPGWESAADYGLGRLELRQGNTGKALQDLTEAARLAPSSAMVLTTMGETLHQEGDTDRAKKVLNTALLINPEAAMAHFRLGMVEAELGNDKAALNHLRKAEVLSPSMPEVDYHLGVLLGKMNDLGPAHLHLAQYHDHLHDRKMAIFHYEKALSSMSGDTEKIKKIKDRIKELKEERS